MGYYINPKDGMDKAIWIKENNLQLALTPPNEHKKEIDGTPCTCVVLVDNGPFTAAAITYDMEELQAFCNPRDFRPKIFAFIPTELLKEFCPLL